MRSDSNSVNVFKWCAIWSREEQVVHAPWSKWYLIDPTKSKWCVSLDLLVHAICMCIFKVERVGGVSVDVWSGYHPSNKFIKLYRGFATGPNLSLTTDHMSLSCSLAFGGIQWSGCRNYSRLNMLLLSTHCLCRFAFHMQVMILVRSYYRLSSLPSHL